MAYPYRTRGVFEDVRALIGRMSNFYIAVPLLFVMVYFWLNGTFHWGAYWEAQSALAYIIMFAFVLSVTKNSSMVWLSKTSFKDGLLNFWLGFILMLAGLIVLNTYFLKGAFGSNSIASAAVYPALVLTVFFVAPVEETIFRGVMREYLKGLRLWWIPLGLILTSAAFAIMHQAVYQGQIMSIWWAFLMGCVFYFMVGFKPSKTRAALGVPGAIGAHACYNLFVLGILSGGIL